MINCPKCNKSMGELGTSDFSTEHVLGRGESEPIKIICFIKIKYICRFCNIKVEITRTKYYYPKENE